MSELAVVSARKIRLQQLAANGDAGAQTALDLAAKPDRFLSTVQIGITLVGVLAGAFGGAGVARYLSELFKNVLIIAPYAETIGFVIVIAAITYLSVVIGELIPKSIALNFPEAIARTVSRPMKFLSTAAAPVVWFLSAPTGFILRLFKVHAVVEPPITDDEIKGLIAQGTEAGVFETSEQEMLESIIHLNDHVVTALMTPRMEVVWLDLDSPTAQIGKTIGSSTYSRFPVARGSLDNIVGYASAKDLLKKMLGGEDFNLEKAIKQPLYVPETMTALQLLERFKAAHTHLAIIVDEHGGVEGLVTMNDVLEAIVGELTSGSLGIKSDEWVTRLDGNSWMIDGQFSMVELKQILELKEQLPHEERGLYHTVAGFVLHRLGRLPQKGDGFEWKSFYFEVAEMQRNRVKKVKISKFAIKSKIS